MREELGAVQAEPATQSEAKRHWRSAKSLLVREARVAFRDGAEWGTTANHYPIVVSPDQEWAFGFAKRSGHVFMFDVFAYHPELPRGRQESTPSWMLNGPTMGAIEGWVVTQDGETLKTGFKSDIEATHWLHNRQSQSVDWAVRHGGYDIVLVRDGRAKWSYKRDVLGREKKRGKGKELGTPPPRFQQFRIGPLRFDVRREQGLVRDVTIHAQGSRDSFRIHIDEPRLQPLQMTVGRILEDLYVSVDTPEKVLEIADKIGITDDHRAQVEGMLEWTAHHERQVREAFKILMPRMAPEG